MKDSTSKDEYSDTAFKQKAFCAKFLYDQLYKYFALYTVKMGG